MRTLVAFIILLTLSLAGCHSEDYFAYLYAEKLPPLDTSEIKRGQVTNLDLLKGIGCWRLGMSKSYYRHAFLTDSAYRHSSECLSEMQNLNFHEWCITKLYFVNDTLDRFTLEMRCRHLNMLYRQLCDLYGCPESACLHINHGGDTAVHFNGLPQKKEPPPYSENVDSLIKTSFEYNGPELPLYRDNVIGSKNEFMALRLSDTIQSSPAVTFQYDPSDRIIADWNSHRALRMTVYKETSLVPYADSTGPLHVARTVFYVTLDFMAKSPSTR